MEAEMNLLHVSTRVAMLHYSLVPGLLVGHPPRAYIGMGLLCSTRSGTGQRKLIWYDKQIPKQNPMERRKGC